MRDKKKTKNQLIKELSNLHRQLAQSKTSQTKHRRILRTLKESERKLETIMKNVNDIIFQISPSGIIKYVSPNVKKIYGYKPEELIDKHLKKTTPINQIPSALQLIKRVLSGETIRHYEVNQRDSKGKIIPVEINLVPVKRKSKIIAVQGVMRDISERKRAAKKVWRAEKRLGDIANNTLTWIWEINANGKYTYASPAVRKILGYHPKELLKRHFYDLFHPEERENLKKEAFKVIVRKQSFHAFLNRNVHKNGKTVWLSTSGVPVFDEKGRLRGYRGADVDITERKKTEEALRESEEKYSNLFRSSNDCIFLHDLKGNIIDVNQRVLDIFGYKKSEILALKISELHPPEAHEKSKWAFEKISKDGFVTFEIAFKKKNGEVFPAEVSSSFLELKGRKFIQGIARDITERKRAEEKLRESEEKYRTTFELAPDGIVTVDLRGIITSCNTAFYKMVGYSEDEVVGKHFTKLPTIRARDIPEYMKMLKFLISHNAPIDFEMTWRHRDRSMQTAEIHCSAMKKGRTTIGFQAIMRDITKRKRTEEAMKVSEQKYKTLTENINVGIYRNTVGPKGRFIEANPAIIKMFGYKNKEEFFKTDVADLYQNSKGRKRFNKKMLKHGFVKDEELQLKKKDGTPFIGEVSSVAVKDKKGKIVYYDGIVEDITERKRVERAFIRDFENLHKTLSGIVNTLALAAAKRDPYTANHQYRVAQLVCVIANEMGFSKEQIEGLRLASIIHDVGKIQIPAEILNKPSRLTTYEFNFIKVHPQVGYDILRKIDFPWPIAKIVLQHHERLNASGYPQGLKGKDIIIEAKILAVADVVEAMTAHRPYRPAFSLKKTLDDIYKDRGILYEPKVVDICLYLFRKKQFKFKVNENSE